MTVNRGFNFDEFKSGGLLEKSAVATWNIWHDLSLDLKAEENQESPCRGGRSQDLLASSPYFLMCAVPLLVI
jgi:hypothetical protein